MRSTMDEEVIGHIRERLATMRTIIGMAHDPQMIQMLQEMVEQAETDLQKLEADSAEPAQQLSVQPVDPGPKPQL
jgi:hypothetical protein